MRRTKIDSDRFVKASITVEACMVMMIVLIVTFSLISLCFYLHNRAWYTAAAGEAAITAATEAVSRATDVNAVLAGKETDLNGLCSFPDWSDGIAGVNNNDTEIVVTAASEIPFFMIGRSFSMSVKENMKIIRPVIFIRTVQAVEIIMEEP